MTESFSDESTLGSGPLFPRVDGVRVPHRYRPGDRALRDIKRFQRMTELLISRAPFRRLVKEVSQGNAPHMRIGAAAYEVLQESGEACFVELFEDRVLRSVHAKSVTVNEKDMALALRSRAFSLPANMF